MDRFTLTERHVRCLRALNVSDADEFPQIDSKRPFGNSDWERDLAWLAGAVPEPNPDDEDVVLRGPERRAARELAFELMTALQVVLAAGSFQPGDYEKAQPYDYRTWRRATGPAPLVPMRRAEEGLEAFCARCRALGLDSFTIPLSCARTCYEAPERPGDIAHAPDCPRAEEERADAAARAAKAR